MASTDWVRRRRSAESDVCSAAYAAALWPARLESGRCVKRCCSLWRRAR